MLLGGLRLHAESTLRIGLGADPDMLDPHLAAHLLRPLCLRRMCDRLVDVDENLKVVPGLATDWNMERGRQNADHESARGRDVPGWRDV